MKDRRWESLDPADEDFVDRALRAGRDELPDDVRMRVIERRLGGALEREVAPSTWWSRSSRYAVVGLAIVALGVRAAGPSRSPSTNSVAPAAPPAPVRVESTPSPTPVTSAMLGVSVPVEALPAVELPAPKAANLPNTREAKARAHSAPAASPAAPEADSTPSDELALLEEASRALDATPQKTLALTEVHMKHFQAPKFAQERERLAVVALVRLGRLDDARRRANAFEATYPESAHLTRVRELVQP
ncbi:hypothetical protein AKJ09_06913 [Labilithrix luteola]|uniref:Uncharacterized protein n=1 Tax=Labilithrix luteola TaxID=1391654 RepID=A0A0K1Q4E8_9BACT|nr:hypothetical protein [Labilithrix luteola]AKV00250.1 hypothetical protein AKJ09_06913 [Labilithrix luteola]